MDEPIKHSILIIDDEPNNIIALTGILENDYDIHAEIDSSEAVDTAIEQMPDIILLDILMPEPDGYEIITKLKALKTTRDIPVIFVTGLDDENAEEKGFSLGAADYILKPFNPATVKMRIFNQLKLFYKFRNVDAVSDKTFFDDLTGIYNRRYFDESMPRIIKFLSRSKGHLSLMMIDIDFFMQYNDLYGQNAGDECLKNIAEIITDDLPRTDDFIIRYSKEDFILVLPNTDEKGAINVVERLMQNIKDAAIPHGGSDIADHVTISVGIATGIVEHTNIINDFVNIADKQLYASKHKGRNRYSLEKLQVSKNE